VNVGFVLTLPPWFGFETVGCPEVLGGEVSPLEDSRLEPISVGMKLPLSPVEAPELVPGKWLLLWVDCVLGLCCPGATPPAPNGGVVELWLELGVKEMPCVLICELDGTDELWLDVIKLLSPFPVEGISEPDPWLPPLLDGLLLMLEIEMIELAIGVVEPLGFSVELELPPLPGIVQLGSVDPGSHIPPFPDGKTDGLV
jgi:hypothetical protein